ncbi:MAG: right-handed parallel beta-helix repeat-containing protein, partial [Deltaproteobacteria bacterium]|nr:right-handed parallel beta-helix repeat-containing protein [Deltaproteobacteria bacterium]
MKRSSIVGTVIALAWALSFSGCSSTNLVAIPPTEVSTDPVQQMLNSLDTLELVQEAVDGAPDASEESPSDEYTVQFEPGVFDFRAVAILHPEDDTTTPRRRYTCDLYNSMGDGPVCVYDRHGLESAYALDGNGVVVWAKQDLVIEGAVDSDGTLLSTIQGIPDPEALGDQTQNSLVWLNVMFSVLGDEDHMAARVTFRNLHFESMNTAVNVVGIPGNRNGSPYRGAEDVTIEDCTFNLTSAEGVRAFGEVNGMTIRNNHFENTLPITPENDFWQSPIDTLGIGEAILDLRIVDNTFVSTQRAMNLWDAQVNTQVEGNVVHCRPGDSMAGVPAGFAISAWDGTQGYYPSGIAYGTIEDNEFHGCSPSIQIVRGTGWDVEGNRFEGSTDGNILIWVSKDSRIEGNTLANAGSAGILLRDCRDIVVKGNAISTTADGTTRVALEDGSMLNLVEGNTYA